MASLTVVGSIIGTVQNSAEISAFGAMEPVKIGGDLQGGASSSSGHITSGGTLASVTVGGSVIGGGQNTGSINSGSTIGPVKIGGNIQGGSVAAAVTLFDSGAVIGQRIASLSVGGSIMAGDAAGGGSLVRSASIQAGDDLGAVTVKGSIIGKPGATVLILARGQAVPGATSDIAIKSLTVLGSVERTDILAGYTHPAGTTVADPPMGVNADAQIGKVSVGGNWSTSNLVAGVQDNTTPERDDSFGEGDDRAIAGGSAGIISKIASITIKGYAFGTVRVNQGTGLDHFGFLAQQIGAFKVGGTSFPLAAGVGTDLAGLLIGATGDLRVREVAF